MTRQWFENTLKVYLDEIDRCVKGKCYWALLHVVLVLPDVCAAMETDGGATGGKEYRGWCERYLADHSISAEDWYQMRCIILHQGRTIDAKQKKSICVVRVQPAWRGDCASLYQRNAARQFPSARRGRNGERTAHCDE
jgi:hypothetical protein